MPAEDGPEETIVTCRLDSNDLRRLEAWAFRKGYVTGTGRANRTLALQRLVQTLPLTPGG